MSLAAGTRLGPYEIVDPIGAGGMGEVYKARDTRLGRLVAIKVSKDHWSERFEREARAVAALNHPHICQLYDVGPNFLVVEFVEGFPIRPPDSLQHLLNLAVQIADGLTAAHAAGIVHRDLKPGNILVTSGGQVKILDFGLALIGPDSTGDASARRTEAVTHPGTTIGTTAYMSPEQARGETVDARSDLWSLGVVLYEMATRVRPFNGATSAVIFEALLNRSPVPVRELNPKVSPDLARIIGRLLEKDRETRYQSAADVRADLKRAGRDTASGVANVTPLPVVSTNIPPAADGPVPATTDVQIAAGLVKRHRAALVLGMMTLFLTIAGILYMANAHRSEPTASASSVPLPDLKFEQLTTSGNASLPAISPDGKFVAYVQQDSNGQSLRIRQTATSSNVQIVQPERGVTLLAVTVTPDSSFVDFVRVAPGPFVPSLWRVPFLGGTPPKRLVDDVRSAPGWSRDGRHMAFIRSNAGATALVIADADGRNERVLATRQSSEAYFVTLGNPVHPHVRPAWSPDGEVIALPGIHAAGAVSNHGMFVTVTNGSVSIAPAEPGVVSEMAWIDSSTLITSRQAGPGAPWQLWRRSYPDGTFSRVTNDLSRYGGVSLTFDGGSVVTGRTEDRGSIWIGDGAASNGKDIAQPVAGAGISRTGAFAWAVDRLIFTTMHPSLFVLTPGGTAEEVITKARSPAATSDGRTIAYVSMAAGASGVLWKADADGRNAVQLAPGNNSWPHITPDDQFVIFADVGSRPWMVPLAGGKPTRIADISTTRLSLSHDGKSIAFLATDQNGVYLTICDLPACTAQRRVTELDSRPLVRWMPDGRAIAYTRHDTTGGNIWVQPLDGSMPRQLTRFADGRFILDFAWSRDGKRLAIARVTTTNDIVLIRGLKQNP